MLNRGRVRRALIVAPAGLLTNYLLIHKIRLYSGHLRGIFFQHGKSDHQNRADSHSYPLGNRSDIVTEHQTLQGLRTTVNLSQMDAAPLGLHMFLVFGSSGRERQKLGVLAKAR